MRQHYNPLDTSARAKRWRKHHPDALHGAQLERRNGLTVVTLSEVQAHTARGADRFGRFAGRAAYRGLDNGMKE